MFYMDSNPKIWGIRIISTTPYCVRSRTLDLQNFRFKVNISIFLTESGPVLGKSKKPAKQFKIRPLAASIFF